MANYKKKSVKVNIPFTYKGKFYDKYFRGTKKDITYLSQYLKQ